MTRLSALVILFAFLAVSSPAHALTLTESELQAGDLIRGEISSSVYYYGDDGLRYVFPNDKTYFTWYEDFDDVQWVSDATLAAIQIGGNVTYKPGVKMLKINSDPTVYAVGGGSVLSAIESEEVAEELYGSNWNQQIDDVPDGLFGNYEIGRRIEFASQYSPGAEEADAFSIATDKNLTHYTLVEITDQGYNSSTTTISSGTAIRFLNSTNENHSVTEWDRVWGSGTLSPGDHYTRYFDETGTWHYYSNYGDRNVFEGAVIVE
ncbi:hypothetical protein HY733_00355 [Candidatus Uhrbacteria bacterium]|nr:hypothetical protein [Candidatus Uhrbacteria bacterium]